MIMMYRCSKSWRHCTCLLFLVTVWQSNYPYPIEAYHISSPLINHHVAQKTKCQQLRTNQPYSDGEAPEQYTSSRRSFVFGSVASGCGILSGFLSRPMDGVVWADTGAEVRGTPLNAFNGLAFQYRGSDFNGLTASDIKEPSISYQEFVSKLKSGDVLFVEFYAPDGDVAYATLKSSSSSSSSIQPKIRIGEGYPIEQHDGYSSPAFAIRTVKNANVPYKFVVPALAKSKE